MKTIGESLGTHGLVVSTKISGLLDKELPICPFCRCGGDIVSFEYRLEARALELHVQCNGCGTFYFVDQDGKPFHPGMRSEVTDEELEDVGFKLVGGVRDHPLQGDDRIPDLL